jgi:hypothetical protein
VVNQLAGFNFRTGVKICLDLHEEFPPGADDQQFLREQIINCPEPFLRNR